MPRPACTCVDCWWHVLRFFSSLHASVCFCVAISKPKPPTVARVDPRHAESCSTLLGTHRYCFNTLFSYTWLLWCHPIFAATMCSRADFFLAISVYPDDRGSSITRKVHAV